MWTRNKYISYKKCFKTMYKLTKDKYYKKKDTYQRIKIKVFRESI